MKSFLSLWMMVLLVALIAGLGTGCANLGGGRQVVALPWSAPNIAMDSLGTAQKNDDASGAEFPGGAGGGTAAQADKDTLAGQADQIVQVGGDARTSRSTDAQLADEQSVASGRETGSFDASGARSQDKRVAPAVSTGQAANSSVGMEDAEDGGTDNE